MKRTAPVDALVLVVTGLFAMACNSTGESEGRPLSSPSPTMAVSETATGSPAWVRPTAAPTPTSIPLDEGDGGLVWEAYEPTAGEDAGWFRWGVRLFDRDTEQFWRLDDTEGGTYSLQVSTHYDVAMGTEVGSAGVPEGRTVLLDLQTGRIRALTPFPLVVTSWVGFESFDSGVILVDVDQREGPRSGGLASGRYEVDLRAGEIRRAAGIRSRGVPVPEGSSVPVGSLSLRTLGSDGTRSFVHWAPDGTEQVILDDVDMAWWNPAQTVALLEQRSGQGYALTLTLFDAHTGELSGVSLDVADSHPNWSPDGRYLALSSGGGTVTFYRLEGTAGPLTPMLATIEASIFADWGPGETPREALLLSDYCVMEDGFNLDRLDLATGDLRRLSTGVGGFWVSDWSPDGEVIAASSPELERGFALLDPGSGADVTPPALRSAIKGMQDVQWSGSGRWLMAAPIGGRDRCL